MGNIESWFDKNYPRKKDGRQAIDHPQVPNMPEPNPFYDQLASMQQQILDIQANHNKQMAEANNVMFKQKEMIDRQQELLKKQHEAIDLLQQQLQHYIDAGPVIARLMADLELEVYEVDEFDYNLSDETVQIEPMINAHAWEMRRVRREVV